MKKGRDTPALVRQEIESVKRIYTHLRAVSYLLSFYATDNVVSEATLVIKFIYTVFNQTTVQFAKALKCKIFRCRDTLFEQQTYNISVEGLSLND